MKKPKPLMCEYQPVLKKYAMNHEAHAVATMVMGEKRIYLCKNCAKLSKFNQLPIIEHIKI
jgi:hypothetical protein